MPLPYSASKDTLAYQLGARPLCLLQDFSGVQMKDVMAPFQSDALEPAMVRPETDALSFYLLNHAVAALRARYDPHEPLGEHLWVVEEYHRRASIAAIRLFRYLMLICTRETRHLGGGGSGSIDWGTMADTCGGTVTTYIRTKIAGGGSGNVANKIQTTPPSVTVGEYVSALRYGFYKGHWSSSFGGKKWGQVTDALVEYVYGRYSAEMMLDVGWALAHNGGPIFNKGMLYHSWTPALYMILDVQRAGQIPQLMTYPVPDVAGHVQPLTPVVAKVVGLLPELIDPSRPYVDWFAVTAAGALHNWSAQMHAQAAQWGKPGVDPAQAAKEAAAKKAATDKAVAEKQAKLEMLLAKKEAVFQVMPGMTVPKVKLPRHDAVAKAA